MKVIYHSELNDVELTPGGILRTIPRKSCLRIIKDKTDSEFDLMYNGTIIDSDTEQVECNAEAELIIRENGIRSVYTVKPSVKVLSTKYARTYEQFAFEYLDMEMDEISSIQLGSLKLYAVDQSSDVYDWTDVFSQIETAFNSFKNICERPKSHLKAVNEVRPIETVKRIGYESIPYLAAHSEDWLARTASGLKPARLFSRVEEDEFQIYENRVVKTLIDLIIGFLRKTEKQLRDQRDQLQGIMNSGVQTGSFGFDVSFQKAVYELMASDEKGNEYRSKCLELVEKLQIKALFLLKKYRILRQTKLYRYLKKSRTVQNPLNETNILTMDKNYSVIFKLWKTIHHVVAPKIKEDDNQLPFNDICNNYQRFCATLCGYASHVLGFDMIEEGLYERETDHIQLSIACSDEGMIQLAITDKTPIEMDVPSNIEVPIYAGDTFDKIKYDGRKLIWSNDLLLTDIDVFCSLFKTRESRGREQSEEKRKYIALKGIMEQYHRACPEQKNSKAKIIPLPVELSNDNRSSFKKCIEDLVDMNSQSDEIYVVALPLCEENEQKLTEYAREDDLNVSFLPLTMFDINSFRRIQNLLYRMILNLDKETCPSCGNNMRSSYNQRICDNCNQLMLTKTVCPNPDCGHEYFYMGYDVPEITITKMESVSPENFFQWDSLFQYKNIVNMTVKEGKIRTICPHCHQS